MVCLHYVRWNDVLRDIHMVIYFLMNISAAVFTMFYLCSSLLPFRKLYNKSFCKISVRNICFFSPSGVLWVSVRPSVSNCKLLTQSLLQLTQLYGNNVYIRHKWHMALWAFGFKSCLNKAVQNVKFRINTCHVYKNKQSTEKKILAGTTLGVGLALLIGCLQKSALKRCF